MNIGYTRRLHRDGRFVVQGGIGRFRARDYAFKEQRSVFTPHRSRAEGTRCLVVRLTQNWTGTVLETYLCPNPLDL